MTNNYDITSYLFNKACANGTPLSGTFELTPQCNLSCKMCYVRLTKEQMKPLGRERSANEWLEIAQTAKDNGMLYLLLTGGEPFIYPEFEYLYTSLKKMGFIISINSNATLLTNKNLELIKNNPPYRINITLYGGSAETYEKLCGNGAAFFLVTDAVKQLKEAGVNIKLNAGITEDNADDLEKIFNFAKKEDIPIQAGAYMFPAVRCEGIRKAYGRLSAAEAGEYLARIDRLRFDDKSYNAFCKNMLAGSETNEEISDTCSSGFLCRAGKSNFWINWNKTMTGCGMLNEPSIDLDKTDFLQAWEQIKAYTKNAEVLSECNKCPKRNSCHVCPAIARAETGDFNAKPEYMCTLTEERLKHLKNSSR